MTVRARPSIKENHARLKLAQKPAKGAPLYSLMVNRPAGRALAAAAHRVGLTPNQVTLVSALFTLSGIAAVALLEPSFPAALIVTTALVIGYALDAADGQLARLRGGGSLIGEWLDHVIDAFKAATIHLAVLIMLYRMDVAEEWLVVPLVFAAAYVVEFFGMLLTDLLSRNAQLRLGKPAPGPAKSSTLMSVMKLPTDYGVLCLSFLLLAVPVAFLWFYLLLAVANVAYTALVLIVWYRKLRVLDGEVSAQSNPGEADR